MLRIFPVTGDALNFGARRMETIMRMAWLPAVLLLIINLATVFTFLSVIAGRTVTFSDISSFAGAEKALSLYSSMGWSQKPGLMGLIFGVSALFQAIVISSFMAPLTRLSGLGEEPSPGVIKLPFGADQVRYLFASLFSIAIVLFLVLAPTAAASYYIVKYIIEALSQTMVSFPNPESLHTVELVTTRDVLIERGAAWMYNLGLPLIVAAPFLLVFWLGLMVHFHPRNRPNAGAPNFFLRALVTGLIVAALTGVLALYLMGLAGGENDFSASFAAVISLVSAVGYLYLNVRFYPYAGVAVCRKEMSPLPMLGVTRGWNIIRLWLVLLIVGVMLNVVQYVINNFALGWIMSSVQVIYQAVAVYTKLFNSGVTAEWVTPFFIWLWNSIKIIVNIFWTFFSYGVVAGLYGRLYRESERSDNGSVQGPAIWLKTR